MSYFDYYDIDELNFLKEQLVYLANDFENRLNILTNIIDDINNSIDRRKY